QTGADGAVGIAFFDGTVFSLAANGRMVLNEFDPDGGASLISLLQGAFTLDVSDTSDLTIGTPVGTLGHGRTKVASLGGGVLTDGEIALAGNFDLYDHDGNLIGRVNDAGELVTI